MSVYFFLENRLPSYAAFELSIVDESGKLKFTKSTDHIFEETNHGWGSPQFISRKILFGMENGLIKDNTLTLTGKFEFINESKFVLESAKSIENKRLEQFYQQRIYTDFELNINGRSIRAHKVLLAATCPALAVRLFDIAENQTAVITEDGSKNSPMSANILKLDDFEFDVAEEMINFVYDGKIRCMEKYAKPLLEAAEKFKMEKLKVYCEKYFYEKLCLENVIETLKLSAKCHAEELKKECIVFLLK